MTDRQIETMKVALSLSSPHTFVCGKFRGVLKDDLDSL